MSCYADSTNLDRNDTQNMMGLHTHTQTHRGIKVSVWGNVCAPIWIVVTIYIHTYMCTHSWLLNNSGLEQTPQRRKSTCNLQSDYHIYSFTSSDSINTGSVGCVCIYFKRSSLWVDPHILKLSLFSQLHVKPPFKYIQFLFVNDTSVNLEKKYDEIQIIRTGTIRIGAVCSASRVLRVKARLVLGLIGLKEVPAFRKEIFQHLKTVKAMTAKWQLCTILSWFQAEVVHTYSALPHDWSVSVPKD